MLCIAAHQDRNVPTVILNNNPNSTAAERKAASKAVFDSLSNAKLAEAALTLASVNVKAAQAAVGDACGIDVANGPIPPLENREHDAFYPAMQEQGSYHDF